MIFYTNFGIPSEHAACTRGPVIFIRPKYMGDAGLLAHERVHVRQWFEGFLLIHQVLYLLKPDYRLRCEVAAYKEQAKHYQDDRIPLFARFIAERYGLDISAAEAEKLLRA